MLDLMRRKKRLKAVLWLVIISLGLGMLLLFIPGQNIGGGGFDTSAASVDGESITMKEYYDAYRRTVDSYSAGGKNKTDPETLKLLGLNRQTLESLINMRVVEYAAKRLGLATSPDEVRQAVETHPSFQDKGVFIGVQRYKEVLAGNNINVTEFENGMRQMLLARKVRNVVGDAMQVSEREIREEFARPIQEAQASFTIFKKDDYKQKVTPADSDLRAYYDANKSKYFRSEERRAQLLIISMMAISPTITVSEDEIQEAWKKQGREETVDASHILFEVKDPAKEAEIKAKAEEILKKAKAGEDFAALATKYSEDTSSAKQGGSLGSFPRGRMVKEFEDVAFALKPGDISGLVRTQFGFHIIKVIRHDIPSLDSSRAALQRSVQLEKASDVAKAKAAEAQKLTETQKDLKAVAQALKIPAEVKETGFIAKNADPFSAGISPNLLEEIFKLKDINSTGAYAVHPQGFAVPKLLEVRLPKPLDFAEAKASVDKDYVETKAAELMQADAKRLSEEATKIQDLEKAAQSFGLSAKLSATFKRDGSPDPDISSGSQFNSVAFEIPVGSISSPVSLDSGNRLVVFQVKSRTPFDEAAYLKQREDVRERMLANWRDAYFQEYIQQLTDSLEKAGKIRINPQALEQVLQYRYY
jgi:peptidyl-prolyl cis-trans isomerase D